MKSIVLASGNAGKIREIQAILTGVEVLPQSRFGVPEAEETGSTFVENAIIKARNAAYHCRRPAIADDSGLVVDALDGAPGVISAHYAGAGAGDQANIDKLLAAMRDVPEAERSARFVCVMVYMRHHLDPMPLIAQGVWEGGILHECRGEHGFGYDPVFRVPAQQCAAAELPAALKNAVSHRGQALQALAALIMHDHGGRA